MMESQDGNVQRAFNEALTKSYLADLQIRNTESLMIPK